MIRPSCAWDLLDIEKSGKNGIKVMSTFSCGGGSSMGYRLAGCDVIAANDIDSETAKHYKMNLNPKYYFLCPVRQLLTDTLPNELYSLDILDGSPPCSTFSLSGKREKTWGKEKHFREGQSKQVLSDLFFDYLDLVELLQPKVAIAENVKGMIAGNAKGYVKMVAQRFREIGYRPQLFLLNAADCGVPQRRERIFFCALRSNIDKPKLKLLPFCKWITAGEAIKDLQVLTSMEKEETKPNKSDSKFYKYTSPGSSYKKACKRITGRHSFFNYIRLDKNRPAPTLSTHFHNYKHWSVMRSLTYREYKRLSSFPDDYKADSPRAGKYLVGMSVPPKMTKAVADAVVDQWL